MIHRPAKIHQNVGYSQAHAMATFWWNRYRDLPRWRFLARREALSCAKSWGVFLKMLQAERAALTSDYAPPPGLSRSAD